MRVIANTQKQLYWKEFTPFLETIQQCALYVPPFAFDIFVAIFEFSLIYTKLTELTWQVSVEG